MSKIIKMTPEIRQAIVDEFLAEVDKAKVADGKISFNKTLTATNAKATLTFSEIAWMKMEMLIREFDKEVAWHGVAYRGEDGEYLITDILVYPQEVTGATVNTDQAAYEMWLMQQEDEVFNNIRMQGHSHVNMGTTPSAVDLTHQGKILEQLEDDMFYIFLIWNKRGDKNIKIYDLEKNTLYETTDVTVKIRDDETGFAKFLSDAKAVVKTKQYDGGQGTGYGTYVAHGYGGYGYGGYGSGNSGYGGSQWNQQYQVSQGQTVTQPNSSGNKTKKDKKDKKKTRFGNGVSWPRAGHLSLTDGSASDQTASER